MNRKSLYVCYASSDYYARETGISLLGFLDNNPDYEPEELFILDYGILPHNKEKLNSIVSNYGKRIEYIQAKQILEKIQEDFILDNFRGSLATYSRAFIDKIIPEYVEKLLYIDSDTVVVGSVSDLKNFNMGDAVMAGCISEGFTNRIRTGDITLYSGNKIYITCGIVLFNLSNWRKNDCFHMISTVLRKKKRYPCADQTLINNAIPEDLLKRIPRKYNYIFHIYNQKQEPFWMGISGTNTKEEIKEAIDNPIIIHFLGSPVNRPWYDDCTSRRADDYYKYKQISPWSSDALYSLKEYKASLKGYHQKIGYWIHQQEIHRASFTLVQAISKTRNTIGKVIKKITKAKPLPSEGIEDYDKMI